MSHFILQNLGIIFLLGIFSQWIAWRMRIPVIVLLTCLGILFGPVLNLVNPRSVFGPLMHPLIELAVAVILFEGAMSLKLHEFRENSKGLIRLFSSAVIMNWLLGAMAGHYIANLSWGAALLISGILIVTGPTVIIPALREAKLIRSTSHYLKWEGIVNDPIGAILAVLVLQFIIHQQEEMLMVAIIKICAIAIGLSWITRELVLFVSKRALIPEFLKIPFFVGAVLVLFILSEFFEKGSGLLTSTLLGIFIGNLDMSSLKELRRFGESLVTLTVSIIFIMLAASLEVNVWYELDWQHYLFIFLLAFVIRPLGIFVTTFKSGMQLNERILIGMYGPRGIVAASVAGVAGETLHEYGIEEGRFVLPIIFSVIILTVIFHSLWLKPLARKLNLVNQGEHGVLIIGASGWSIELARKLQEANLPVMISDASWYQLALARRLGITTHFGQILEDIEFGAPDLSEYNYLLALTEDDNYNALICNMLKHDFGHDHVYRLPKHDDNFNTQHNLTRKEFCTINNSTKALYENMMQKSHLGWEFKMTTLSDIFDYKTFRKEHDLYHSIYFLIIRTNKRVEMFDMKNNRKLESGDTILYLAPKS
jgi:NhaP-type Na+/H+ or K+/H+ antiporter